MPRIFDNIEQKLIKALQDTLKISERADFCVGYFNLRGWRHIDTLMDSWRGGEQECCRLLIGMHEKPQDELRKVFSLRVEQGVDNATVARIKTRVAQEFREQLMIGAPLNEDKEGLRRLSKQLLEKWFNERWDDRWCLDISEELANIIDESWAREEMIPPYHIYLKMAYHLSEDARTGLLEFNIPRILKNRLFEYQAAAVRIAAHHLNKRGGVLIGDVVGLGKTLMATALARIMQEDYGMETLVICPKNLVKMWKGYIGEYQI